MQESTVERHEHVAGGADFGATVTIFFSDIRGFTEYTDAHGDAASWRMLQHHNDIVREQIALFGGHVVKTIGDSFMVSFNAARPAISCAVAIQRVLEQYNRSEQGPRIDVGVGINTGEPVQDAGDLFGGAVNLAARICAAAGPGEILVSETVRGLVGRMEGVGIELRGDVALKGFHDPQRLYRIVWNGVAGASAPATMVQTAPEASQTAAVGAAPRSCVRDAR